MQGTASVLNLQCHCCLTFCFADIVLNALNLGLLLSLEKAVGGEVLTSRSILQK